MTWERVDAEDGGLRACPSVDRPATPRLFDDPRRCGDDGPRMTDRAGSARTVITAVGPGGADGVAVRLHDRRDRRPPPGRAGRPAGEPRRPGGAGPGAAHRPDRRRRRAARRHPRLPGAPPGRRAGQHRHRHARLAGGGGGLGPGRAAAGGAGPGLPGRPRPEGPRRGPRRRPARPVVARGRELRGGRRPPHRPRHRRPDGGDAAARREPAGVHRGAAGGRRPGDRGAGLPLGAADRPGAAAPPGRPGHRPAGRRGDVHLGARPSTRCCAPPARTRDAAAGGLARPTCWRPAWAR